MEPAPISCDMTGAQDGPAQRLDEYRLLFAQHLLRSEHTAAGVRHTFRGTPGVADQLRDLTMRERACCGFLTFAVTDDGEELHWDIGTVAGPRAEAVLEEFLGLADALPGQVSGQAQNPV